MEVSPKYRNDPSCYSLWSQISQISQRWLSLKISLNIARGASIKGHADFITCLQFVAVCAHHGIHPGRTILSLTCSRCVFFLRVGGARVPRGRLGARIWSLCCRPSSKRRLKAILYAICHLPCLGSWIVWGGKNGKNIYWLHWLVLWNMAGLFFAISWECHDPNWLIFFRGLGHPPTSIGLIDKSHPAWSEDVRIAWLLANPTWKLITGV